MGGSDSTESTCNAGDLGLIPELGGSPGGGNINLLQYSCLENPHGQRNLAGYSPWGCSQSDANEHTDNREDGGGGQRARVRIRQSGSSGFIYSVVADRN